METRLHQLYHFGQSPWLDYISRIIIKKGHLQELINKGIVGVTSNPTIFEKAIRTGHDYDEMILQFAKEGETREEIYEKLIIQDIQNACDLFLPIYQESNRKDGYVSLEVNPYLAYNTGRTVQEAERLFRLTNRPNVMIKVPATKESLSAVEALIGQEIHVNITLVFSQRQYSQSAETYLAAIEKAYLNGKDISRIHSVVSVFISRVDNAFDLLLDKKANETDSEMKRSQFSYLKGKAAVANARMIYRNYRNLFDFNHVQEMERSGGNIQRVLWASTGTKNPQYSDVKYVQELMAPDTINTMPEETIEAFLDHGKIENSILVESSEEQKILSQLEEQGMIVEEICNQLLKEGVHKFIDSYESLLNTIEQKMKSLVD